MNDEYFAFVEEVSSSSSLDSIKESLLLWRDNTRDIINCILYIQDKMIDEEKAKHMKSKIRLQYEKIFVKLQELCTKEIDFISEGIVNTDFLLSLANPKNDMNKLLTQVGNIRNNYNKIVDNINKTITSSKIVSQLCKEYLRKYPMRKKEVKINESCIKEHQKSQDVLLNEIGNELNNISNISKDKESFLSHNKSQLKLIDKEDLKESPGEILQQFKKSLRLTRYKPSPQYKEALRTFMKDSCNIDKPKLNDNIMSLYKEIESTRGLCNNIKVYVHDNCYLLNEKKSYDKMKEDNTMINKEISNIKKTIKTGTEAYKALIQKITVLEEDQIQLQKENEKLIKYIKERYFNTVSQTVNSNYSLPQSMIKQKQILTSLGTQNISSIDLFNNINRNLEQIY